VEQTHALGVKAATGELARPVEHARAKSNSIEALLDGSGAWAATLTYYRLTQHKNAVSQAVVLITSSRMCVAVSVPHSTLHDGATQARRSIFCLASRGVNTQSIVRSFAQARTGSHALVCRLWTVRFAVGKRASMFVKTNYTNSRCRFRTEVRIGRQLRRHSNRPATPLPRTGRIRPRFVPVTDTPAFLAADWVAPANDTFISKTELLAAVVKEAGPRNARKTQRPANTETPVNRHW
jgi:hypothetical protein